MDVNTISTLITTLGFPIVCVIAMGWFIYQIFQKTTSQSQQNMEKVQERCKEREEKLYAEIAKNREVNAKAIETIAHYADRLEVIQRDISEIKTDVSVLMNK